MARFEEIDMLTPYNQQDKVLKIIIANTPDTYRLPDLVHETGSYIFVIWLKSDKNCIVNFNILGSAVKANVTTSWTKLIHKVHIKDLSNIKIDIAPEVNSSTYYYEAYLAKGIADTSWTPAPEDIGDNYYTKVETEAKFNVESEKIQSTVSRVETVEKNSLTSSVEEYYLSSSATQLVGGSWSTNRPAWTQGKFIWNRRLVAKGDGTTSYQPDANGVCISGNPGSDGKDGIPGKDGADGRTTYFHIKYSVNANGHPMSEVPSTYIGTYVDFTQADSTNHLDYTWSKFEGADGSNGIPGKNGIDGKTSYLHIAYSNSADGSIGFSTTDSLNKQYIGQYTDFVLQDSSNYSDYKWTKIKGDDATVQSDTPPDDKTLLWLDTSMDPPLLKRWNGTQWVVVNDVSSEITSIRKEYKSDIKQEAGRITLEVATKYYNKGEVDKLVGELNTQFVQTDKDFQFNFKNVSDGLNNLSKETNDKFNEFSEYIRFAKDEIEMGSIRSPFKQRFTREKNSFLQNGVEIAYFGNRKMYVTDGEFKNSCQIDKFGFIPESNGSLSFRKVR